MDKIICPHFICIGPTRTGTTWLYETFRKHPQVWLPPVKELKYVGEGTVIPAYSLQQLTLSGHWHYREMRSLPFRMLGKVLLGRENLENLAWALRYSLRPGASEFSFEWYSALFTNRKHQLSGDISPIYYHLPESRVSELSQHSHQTKVLVFVRNPIERVWSTALKALAANNKRDPDDVTRDEFISHFDYAHRQWPSYESVIDLWKRNFPQVFVGRFDDLQENPQLFFRDVCDFFGVNADVPIDQVDRRVNKGLAKKMPVDLAKYLRNQYFDEINRLAELGYCKNPAAWLGVADE